MARRVVFEAMQEPKGMRHPSGKPLRRGRFGVETVLRMPPGEPLSPGLQKRNQTYAVGFLANLDPTDEFDD